MKVRNQGAQVDLIIAGGQLLDPVGGALQRADVGIRNGVVAVVAPNLDRSKAVNWVDVDGSIVTPGLIDLHLHAYPGATYWGIDADYPCLSNGVTTAVDAGSAGASTFDGLRRTMLTSSVRLRAFLNIANGGLASPFGELISPEAADIEAAVRIARRYPDLIVGFKLRASPNVVGDHGLQALAAVRRAADELALPIMVHVSEGPPSLSEVVDHLKAGDILTHCFTPYENGVVDSAGRIKPEAAKALDRGVHLDVGHGSGSFSFWAAEAYISGGGPLVITSTDLHRKSVLGPAFGMTTVMTKMLTSGMRLEDVLVSATRAPAEVLGIDPRIRAGSNADLAVLRLERGKFTLWDSRGEVRTADEQIRALLTVRGGEIVFVEPSIRVHSKPRS